MSMASCPYCGAPLQNAEPTCPYCRSGLLTDQLSTPKKHQEEQVNIPEDWVQHRDEWYGFLLAHPPGWQVETRRGQVSVRQDPLGFTAVSFYPFNLKNPGNALQLAQSLIKKMHQVSQSFQAWIPEKNSQDSDQVTMKTRDMRLGQQVEGIFIVRVKGTNILTSGYTAPTGSFARQAGCLKQILSSLRPIDRISRRVFQEPAEGAYTLQIPIGWKVNASVNRASGAGVPTFNVIGDPQGLISAGKPSYHWSFTIDMSGILGGFGSSRNLPHMTASQFCQQIIAPWMNQSQAVFRLEGITDRPDLSELYAQELTTAGFPSGSMEIAIAIMQTSYEEQGVRVCQKTNVSTKRQRNQFGPVAFWDADLNIFYRAPEGQLSTWEPVLVGVLDSMRYNPGWESAEVQYIQGRIAVSQADARMRLGQISKTLSETSDIAHNSYMNRQASQDRIAEKWSDASLGVHPVESPTGDVYKVQDGYDQYWKDGLGNFFGGSWLDQPDIDWTPLSEI